VTGIPIDAAEAKRIGLVNTSILPPSCCGPGDSPALCGPARGRSGSLAAMGLRRRIPPEDAAEARLFENAVPRGFPRRSGRS
jgi:enoyl-CoA hydratase/carnithine racemase